MGDLEFLEFDDNDSFIIEEIEYDYYDDLDIIKEYGNKIECEDYD